MGVSLLNTARTAVFLGGAEPLFVPRKEQKELYGIVRDESALFHYARSHTRYHLIPIRDRHKRCSASLEEMIVNTDVTEQLKRNSIRSLVVPSQSSRKIARWAATHTIQLLGAPFLLQTQLEDKIHFDRLARNQKLSLPPRIFPDTKKRALQKFVVQERNSMGGFGTTFTARASKKMFGKNLLVRTYIPGVPLGVSIFMDPDGNYFCSAIRRQCYARNHPFPKTYLGIQWVPTRDFSSSERDAIEDMTQQLCSLFSTMHFVGVANIDFILYKNQCFVLECNPRFSGATPHIVMYPRLTNHANPWRFLMNAFRGIQNGPVRNPRIPPSLFRGSAIDIDAPAPLSITELLPVGTATFPNVGEYVVVHDHVPGTTLATDDTICTLFSDSPLFTQNGNATANVSLLRKACFNMCRKK